MTDPMPASDADWAAEVDEHLADGHGHHADQATTDRDQATTDRDQATTDRDQATTDRTQATTDRTQATIDRTQARRSAVGFRADVTALGLSVADLSKSVAALHDLIAATMATAEQARTEAAQNPTRHRLNTTVVALVAFALVLAGIGGWVVHDQQQQAYQACQVRNAQHAQQQEFAGKLDAAVQRARREGSVLGRDLGSLLTPMPQAPTVMCHPPRPRTVT